METQSTLDAVYVYVVPWSELPIVPSYPHYPQKVHPLPVGVGVQPVDGVAAWLLVTLVVGRRGRRTRRRCTTIRPRSNSPSRMRRPRRMLWPLRRPRLSRLPRLPRPSGPPRSAPSTLVSLSVRLKDLLGPVTRVQKKQKSLQIALEDAAAQNAVAVGILALRAPKEAGL